MRTLDGEYTADAVILAMGSAYRKLGLAREDELSGHGVSWCATCDGFFFRDQDIAVVGGGDTAMEEATFLTRFAKSVTVVHRRDALRASRIMVDRAEANPKISWAWNTEVVDIHGEGTVTGVRLRDTVTGDERDLAVGGLFIAIGHEPAQRAGQGPGRPRRRGLRAHHRRHPHQPRRACSPPATSSTTPTVRPITAAGTGCQAALDAERFLAAPGRIWHRRSSPAPTRPAARRIDSGAGINRTGRGVTPPPPQHQETTHGQQHQDRHRRQLRHRRAAGRRAGARRLLGRVVRPVPPGRPGARGDRRRVPGQDHDRQGQHRREPGHRARLPDHVDPDDVGVPKGQVVKSIVGARPKAAILKELSDFVG